MLEVDKEKIQKILESDLTSDEIAEYSGIAYTTARELKDGITSIDEASFRTQVKLTYGYKIAFEGHVPEKVSLKRRIAIVDAAIGINKIDGLVLTDEYIEKMYDMVHGRIKRSEFAEYVLLLNND
ncbi:MULTISPECIES: hypothetical protein [Staphylococcaceae]|uniref:Uncharacterized protein n=2 Tax=Macrococcoides caseolyticum TaxID=69966 RepID=A0A1S7BGS6_9STAP|nr:hypothetical protein [Macrococcus]AQX82846.1 hypothetical protein [Macrococcus caseolyticus]AQX82887.1 hypothetical protein [Macrococcus caseolyticus]ARQ03568.1 hypothetical protein CA207_02920 [Macrococcus caseolyticus]AYE55830.1 hypothetical protein [Macrococcus caseolyticus]MCO4095865.1 hypothetical protein [Macrococcus canis]